ncbi:hypothetical protein ACSSZE_01915 [Acidithiobacillus caldus]
MDIQTVDQQYQQLQQEAQGVMQSLQMLAGKLKTAADGGNQDAREWLLDLKELALNIQQEQQQAMAVMQALHQAMQNAQNQWQPGYPQTPQPQGYGQSGMQPGQGGGFLSNFLNSGFGRAIELGAGFGIGDDLINSIF